MVEISGRSCTTASGVWLAPCFLACACWLGGCGGGGGDSGGVGDRASGARVFVTLSPATRPPTTAPALAPGITSLHLQAAGGTRRSPSPERVCEDATGDELCAVQADVEGTGGVRIVGFAPVPGADVVWHLRGERLSVNRMDAEAPGVLGVVQLGELTLDVQGAGLLRLNPSSVAIGSGLEARRVHAPEGATSEVLAHANP